MLDLPIAARAVLLALGLCIAIVSLCRTQYVSPEDTAPLVRVAIVGQFATGVLLAMAATARPDWLLLGLMLCPAAMLLSLAASARLWIGGQPVEFERVRRAPPAEPIQLQTARIRRWG